LQQPERGQVLRLRQLVPGLSRSEADVGGQSPEDRCQSPDDRCQIGLASAICPLASVLWDDHRQPSRSSALTTQSVGHPPWWSSTTHCAAFLAISASAVASTPAMWGLKTTLGSPSRGLPGSGGSEPRTSSPAPARWPEARLS